MMSNEEKKDFILSAHKLFTEIRPYDNIKNIEHAKEKEDYLWQEFYNRFYSFLPKSLFKYRICDENAIKNLENDKAWFSHPIDFDDTLDSTINNDIEKEIDDFKKDPSILHKELSKVILSNWSKQLGFSFDLKMIDEIYPLFNIDGSFDESSTKKFISSVDPNKANDNEIEKIKKYYFELANFGRKPAIKLLEYFVDINDRVRRKTYTLSLAEESDNQAMWGLYADESKGFCIEYSFSPNDFLGQRMLLNLFPIYYGDKPMIKFFDILKNSLSSKEKINGMTFDDYQKFFLSTYTKDRSYEFQKEWRITFDKQMGGNLQNFPFVKSITLGERISEENATRLINIAIKKNIRVYQRKRNKTSSKIIIEKIY